MKKFLRQRYSSGRWRTRAYRLASALDGDAGELLKDQEGARNVLQIPLAGEAAPMLAVRQAETEPR